MKNQIARWCVLLCIALSQGVSAEDFSLAEEKVAEGVWALIGPTTDRTYENHGLNANFGVIDTPDGAILIDSGASRMGADILANHVQALTGKAVKWVINTGAQDHRWFGNARFAAQGAEIIAHQRTVATQTEQRLDQIARLEPALKERLAGTDPTTASTVLETSTALTLGGRTLEVRYLADAHFPGDVVVWMPQEGVLFSGDHIYVDRLLGILPVSNAQTWLEAFSQLEALAPAVIVPGHGRVSDLARARADTGDYLAFIVTGVSRLAEEMAGVDQAMAELGDAPAFERLANYSELHRRNVSQAYLRMEAGL